MAAFNSWKDVFDIERRDHQGVKTVTSWFKSFFLDIGVNQFYDGDSKELDYPIDSKVKRFFLIDKRTGEVLGRYDSLEYTVNRAKFKFKRMMRAIDRKLLGTR